MNLRSIANLSCHNLASSSESWCEVEEGAEAEGSMQGQDGFSVAFYKSELVFISRDKLIHGTLVRCIIIWIRRREQLRAPHYAAGASNASFKGI